jgi:site-specific DNA recombinase
VYRILKNPFYIGSLRWKGEIIKGNHESIISKEEFDRVQDLRKKYE